MAADPRARRVTPGELIALLALTAFAASVWVPLFAVGLPLSGAFGLYAEDQLQYFAWIREASRHILIGNRFDLAPGPRAFLHPVFALSGLVSSVTHLSIPLSYLLWEPVAIALLFIGCRRYVHRLLSGRGGRLVALWLALFCITPLATLLGRLRGIAPDLVHRVGDLSLEFWTAATLWGHPTTAIAIALMPLVLLTLEAWREEPRPANLGAASAGALLISWLHPWQGATLVIVIVGVEALRARDTRRLPPAGLFIVLLAFVLPAAYYLVLSRTDPAWRGYGNVGTLRERPWLATFLAVAPLAVPALLVYRLPAKAWQERAVRLWPIAALLVYLMPLGGYPVHALNGLALPLAILAVQGVASVWPRPPVPLVAMLAALLIVPGWLRNLRTVGAKARSGEHGYFIRPSERQALAALEADPRPGGVLAPVSPGALVPFTTGREVYVGHDSWSPDFAERSRQAEDLFTGRMSAQAAQAFIRSTRARFLFADCRHPLDLNLALGSTVTRSTRYGCAAVYELLERPEMRKAAGAPDL